MKIKHIVITRLLSRVMGNNTKEQILERSNVMHRLGYLVGHVIPTLNNQTNTDFEFVVVVHPELDCSIFYDISRMISSAEPRFQVNVVPADSHLDQFISQFWETNDIVILTRTDDDDFVNKYAVQEVRDTIGDGDFQLISCGYSNGYKYSEGDSEITHFTHDYKGKGHMSVFFSMVCNTKRMKYTPRMNPISIRHTKVYETLGKLGYQVRMVEFPRKDAFIYFRHRTAITYSNTLDKVNPVKFDEGKLRELEDLFAFRPDMGGKIHGTE